MRKLMMIWPVAAIAVIAGAAFLWSKSPLLGPQTARASLGVLDPVAAREPGPRITPFELMTRHGNDLPAESFKDPI
jgi:hypothetical protein